MHHFIIWRGEEQERKVKMNEIEIFKNPEFGEIRTLTIDGEPWFVGKDVAERLGYERPTKAVQDHIDSEDKDEVPIQDSIGRMQKTPIINESGLYSLVLSSKLPTAKAFKRWVTSEVIPAIRKHGVYAVDKLLEDPDTLIAALNQLKEERARRKELETQVGVKDQQIAELQPKAGYYDLVLQCKDAMAISKIAKDFGLSAVALNKILHDAGVQYKQGDVWLLYQKYAGKGYTQTKTDLYADSNGVQHTKVRTCWTQKGRLFIYDLLKSRNILPLIERQTT